MYALLLKLLEKLIQRRNPQFKLGSRHSASLLVAFAWANGWALLRGFKLLLRGRKPRALLLGRGVRFTHLRNIALGSMVRIGQGTLLSALGTGKLTIGNRSGIGAYSQVVIATTPGHPGKHITIGNRVGIGEYAYLGGAGGLTIGNDCIIGQYFSCHPENHNFTNTQTPIRLQGTTRKGITIGANCWVGAKVTVLDGVHIGQGCVIAAGAVVTQSMPPNAVVAGVPAKIIRYRTTQKTALPYA